MRKKRKTTEPGETQPYDSSFKALVDDQTLAMLSFFLGEEVLFFQEVKESLFKRETIKTALRVDCVYLVHSRKHGHQRIRVFLVHLEFETAPTEKIVGRLFEYYGIMYNKRQLAIVQVLVCPFETTHLPTPPHEIEVEVGDVQITHHYRAVALWEREAAELLAKGWVELYALLPAMKGATFAILSEALKAMRAFYAQDESRLRTHLLWFDTFLERTTTVSEDDKERTWEAMNDFESLLDSGHFVRQRVAKSRAEGLAEGEAKGRAEGEAKGKAEGFAEGEAKGLQEALTTIVEVRFPTLLDLAQQRAQQVKQPEALRLMLKAIKAAPNEEFARVLLDTLAA
jgi:hypothetical protein